MHSNYNPLSPSLNSLFVAGMFQPSNPVHLLWETFFTLTNYDNDWFSENSKHFKCNNEVSTECFVIWILYVHIYVFSSLIRAYRLSQLLLCFERRVQFRIFPFRGQVCGNEDSSRHNKTLKNNKTLLTYVIRHHCIDLMKPEFFFLLEVISCLHIASHPLSLFPHFTGFPFASKPSDFGTPIPSDFSLNFTTYLLPDMVHLDGSLVNLPSAMQLQDNHLLTIWMGSSSECAAKSPRIFNLVCLPNLHRPLTTISNCLHSYIILLCLV